ncbi:MAG TPA: succinate dehydrogenase assembly factor 2 [Novosphingobium sp.]|nr:succinate dehydrogenase assembly factor 2 [Novosphingobium sp.]
MSDSDRRKKLRFRAWHRGTREADYMIGCYFDRFQTEWDAAALDWFERLLDEEDGDVMAWALGTQAIPPKYAGALMEAMQRLDYVDVPH